MIIMSAFILRKWMSFNLVQALTGVISGIYHNWLKYCLVCPNVKPSGVGSE